MDAYLRPCALHGEMQIVSSKSWLHRALICAALSDSETTIFYRGMSEDVQATVRCLRALGAQIEVGRTQLTVQKIRLTDGRKQLDCAESAATLRFLLPLAAALGADAEFLRRGSLPRRPVEELCNVLSAHGCTISEQGNTLRCKGKLRAGAFSISGAVSSQYISGLLLSLPLLETQSQIVLSAPAESAPYLELTGAVLNCFGVRAERTPDGFTVPGAQRFCTPHTLTAQGDWSNAAFFLAAGALSERGVCVTGLQRCEQGDRQVLACLRNFGAAVTETEHSVTVSKRALRGIELDARDIPDLVPVLAVLAAVSEGTTRIYHAQRLRKKESDRLAATEQLLCALGAQAEQTDDGLVICGQPRLNGAVVSGSADHRIVMSAAVTAACCETPLTITGAQAVKKSYPSFFDDLHRLNAEVQLR